MTHVTGIFAKSTVEDARVAIQAAQNAFESWKQRSAYERAEYIKTALELMKQKVDSIAEIITAENGKTLAESKGEINSAIIEMEFQIHQGLRLAGDMLPSRKAGVLSYQIRCPIGPVGVIAPWNFPFNVPSRKMTPALMAGNTCVLKPAQLTSGVGVEFVKLFEEAGLPPGVINLVTGSGRIVGEELTTNPAVQAITFTGSTEIGATIHTKAATTRKRTQLEMGGQNPLVVLADADLEAAADAAALAAFACAGQWCIATSRIMIEKSVRRKFVDLLLARVKKIVVGPGSDERTTMGPVCGKAQLEHVLDGIERGKAEGGKALAGGNRMAEGDLAQGCFIAPTVFDNVKPEAYIAQEEIFGPVVSIMPVSDLDEAIAMANGVKFGLGSSIYTRDINKAMTFVEKTEVGLTHVNMHTAYKEPQYSFGGIKASGHGIPEAGKTGIEFFTEHKTVYVNVR